MKKFFGLLLGLLAIAGVQAARVPSTVSATFHKLYPDASVRKWETGKNAYLVKFRMHNANYVATFAADGNWERTERKYALTYGLPAQVKEGFKHSGYADCEIDGIREVNAPNRHDYVIWVDDGNFYDSDHHDNFTQGYLLYFSPDGHMEKTRQTDKQPE